jgi:5-methyltetrahydropteroyltriglutamate--homocysteine methyltransferase
LTIRTAPPFRADHVGSLLRPKSLLAARDEHEAGRLTAEQLRVDEDAAIRDAVALQQEVGLRGITDGGLRRGSWHMDFIYEIGGVERSQDNLLSKFHNEQGTIEFTPTKPEVRAKLSLGHTIFGEDFEYLAQTVTRGNPS